MDLDPTEVPPFPRWRMELTSDGRALVRGRPVVVPAGEEPRKVAIEAVAQLARDQDLRAVRVEAVGPDGREWPMVVSAVGEHWDLSTSRRTAASGRPAWQLPAAVTAAVAVVVAVVVVAVLAVRRQAGDPAVVASDAAPTAQPTEFPILPPDGWTTRARWATGPLASDDPPARVGPGAVAVLTRDGQVEVRDVETGAVRWTAEAPSGVTGGAHVTVLEQHQVVAVVTDDELVWWPVDGADKPRSLHLPDRTEQVSFAGRSPMAVLPDQHVAVPDVEPTTWKDRVIPAGAVALGNDEGRVIAADRTGHWWAIDTDAQIAPLPHRLSAPGAGQLAGWPATRTASCSLSGSPPTARRSACTTPRGDRRCGQRCRAGTLTPRSPSPPSRTASRWSTTGRSPTPRTVASAACPRAGRPRPSCRTGPTGTVADQRQVIALTGPAQAVTAEAVPVDVMATTALAFAQVAGDPVLYALTKGSEIDQPTPVATSRFSTRPTTRPTPRPTGATSTAVPSKPSGPVKPPTSKPSPKPTTRTTTRTTTPSTKPSGRAG